MTYKSILLEDRGACSREELNQGIRYDCSQFAVLEWVDYHFLVIKYDQNLSFAGFPIRFCSRQAGIVLQPGRTNTRLKGPCQASRILGMAPPPPPTSLPTHTHTHTHTKKMWNLRQAEFCMCLNCTETWYVRCTEKRPLGLLIKFVLY